MKTKSKKKKTVVLSVVLVLIIAIGATLAYLSSTTEEKTNAFSFAENIRGQLDEPNWKPKEGENVVPGYEIKKDPMVTNKSGNGIDEYTAIKVSLTAGAELSGRALTDPEAARLLGLLEITWNSNWTRIDGSAPSLTAEQVYVYNSAISPGEVTDPLFSSVKVKEDITDADHAWLAGIVLSHTDACYTFGSHDDSLCDVTYKHHAHCALQTGTASADQKAATPKGGTVGGKTCDCTPAQVHEEECPTLIGTLKGTCGHTVDSDSICGFQIKVKAAVVQAGVEGMDSATDTDTINNLLALFS